MKVWTEFEPLVIGRLPELPVPTLRDEARRAARIFYADTRAWRDSEPTTIISATVVGQGLYLLPALPTGGELVGVCAAWLDRVALEEDRNQDVADTEPPTNGTPTRIRAENTSQVRLLPEPDTAGQVVIASLAYCPTEDSTGIEDELFKQHWEAIAELIVARCAIHVGQRWSNPKIAGDARRQYHELALDAGSRAGSVGRRLRTRAHTI